MRYLLLVMAIVLAGCETTSTTQQPNNQPVSKPSGSISAAPSRHNFTTVVNRIRPVAVRECIRRTKGVNCNFKVIVDPRANAPANAYQTVDKNGQPIVIFTKAMIAKARNGDELAFVLGHEFAHHISGHLGRQAKNAAAGAILLAGLAGLAGGDSTAIDAAQQVGANIGARSYSKKFELEADKLGTVITYRAGYNPLIGAKFFSRIADPGDKFLGTHPPNAARVKAVMDTARQLGIQ